MSKASVVCVLVARTQMKVIDETGLFVVSNPKRFVVAYPGRSFPPWWMMDAMFSCPMGMSAGPMRSDL